MWSFCAFFPLARASVGPRAEFGAPQPLSVSAPGHAPRGSVEYEQASGRGPCRAQGRVAAPLTYLSYFCMWWAGTVAIDVTTSGCVALVEAAPPTDAFNLYISALAHVSIYAPLGSRAAPDHFPPHFLWWNGVWVQGAQLSTRVSFTLSQICVLGLRSVRAVSSGRCPSGSDKQEPPTLCSYSVVPTSCRCPAT